MNTPTLIELLNWRYATKKMNPEKSVAPEKVEKILEAIRMAPTSSGTQPFEIYAITNTEIREKIRKVGMDQAQITDGSHLLVFAAWDNYTAERIDEVRDQMIEERGAIPMINEYYENLKTAYLHRPSEINFAHAAHQAYIALGVALLAAAELGVDSTPMEGFDSNAVDKILNLNEKGLRSVVIMPLGYRDVEGDWLVSMKKMRKTKSALINEIK